MTRLLVVEDEPQLLRALVLNLTNRGYDVTTASTVAVALAQVRRLPPDALVLDLGLPDGDGTDVIREVHTDKPALPIIVLSARTGSHDKVHALDLGADRLRDETLRHERTRRQARGGHSSSGTRDQRSAGHRRCRRHRSGRTHCSMPGRHHGALHANRVANPRRTAALPRPASALAGTARDRPGRRRPHRKQLPAHLLVEASAQTRGRTEPPPLSTHGTRNGLPLSAVSLVARTDRAAAWSILVTIGGRNRFASLTLDHSRVGEKWVVTTAGDDRTLYGPEACSARPTDREPGIPVPSYPAIARVAIAAAGGSFSGADGRSNEASTRLSGRRRCASLGAG